MAEVPEFTRRRLERIADAALREAGVLGVVPTPLDALGAVARIRAVAPMPDLPDAVRTPGRPLLGALWFEERTIFVDERQAAARRRFTHAHELVHALCPWHEAALREDTEAELFRPTAAALEAEANLGAGLLIFQRGDFTQVAAGPPSLATALALCARYGASRHAAVHHYVQAHDAPVALLVAGRFPRRDGSLPVWRSVESPTFGARHGQVASRVAQGLRPGDALHALAEAARVTSDVPATAVRLGGDTFRAEAYDNRHAFLVLLNHERRARAAA
jgi:IrrE N-terminal-like domain